MVINLSSLFFKSRHIEWHAVLDAVVAQRPTASLAAGCIEMRRAMFVEMNNSDFVEVTFLNLVIVLQKNTNGVTVKRAFNSTKQ